METVRVRQVHGNGYGNGYGNGNGNGNGYGDGDGNGYGDWPAWMLCEEVKP